MLLGRAQVGVDDDFFALGGDSVLATTAGRPHPGLAGHADRDGRRLFATRTVAALATVLAAREPAGDRLEQVAELYLEVAGMDDADVATALDAESVG